MRAGCKFTCAFLTLWSVGTHTPMCSGVSCVLHVFPVLTGPLDKGMSHVSGGMKQNGAKFHHATQNTPFKT